MGAGLVMILIGLLLMIGPWFAPESIPMAGRLAATIGGGAFSIVGAILIIITSLYVKTTSNTAFVRNGWGGEKVIIGGGCLVFPVVHTKTDVSLGTIKMEVDRSGPLALITGDKLRGDIRAEFFIKVDKTPEDVGNNARTLGVRATDSGYVTTLMEPKLISALRSVAAKSPLEDLNSNREAFATSVGEAVRADLKHNGYTLESVTISSLDQTSLEHFRDDNIFDAEGRRHAIEATSAQKIQANVASRKAEQAIAEQDTQTRQIVADQEFQQSQANAKRDADIKKAQAEQNNIAASYAADQERLTREAIILADQQVGITNAEKDKQIKVAQITAEQAGATADVLKEQAIEVANREKGIAIAEAEQRRSAAQAEQLVAEQNREREAQGVITVTKEAEAQRDKTVSVIAAQKQAEVNKTNENIKADIEAYSKVTLAEGEKNASEKNAQAITITATAEKDAKIAQAEGMTAVEMVPVNVKQKEVEVDAKRQTEVEQARVNVLKQELEAKDAHGQVSVDLEKFRIVVEAYKEVGIADANAMGVAMGSANLNVFGDTNTVARIGEMFKNGQGINALLSGMSNGKLGINEVVDTVKSAFGDAAADKLVELTGKATDKLTGGKSESADIASGAKPKRKTVDGDGAEAPAAEA